MTTLRSEKEPGSGEMLRNPAARLVAHRPGDAGNRALARFTHKGLTKVYPNRIEMAPPMRPTHQAGGCPSCPGVRSVRSVLTTSYPKDSIGWYARKMGPIGPIGQVGQVG